MTRSIQPLQEAKPATSLLPLSQIQSSTDRGYAFLQEQLSVDNGFQGMWEADRWQQDPLLAKHENFSSLLIANLLGDHPKALTIRDHLIRILRKQNNNGFTNFFRDSSPISNDIHSTCLSLDFLLE